MTRNHSLKDPPLGLVYFVVVDRGITAPHQAALVELPQFIPMRSPPLSLCIVALVLEPDRDAVAREAPEVLLEPRRTHHGFATWSPLCRRATPSRGRACSTRPGPSSPSASRSPRRTGVPEV